MNRSFLDKTRLFVHATLSISFTFHDPSVCTFNTFRFDQIRSLFMLNEPRQPSCADRADVHGCPHARQDPTRGVADLHGPVLRRLEKLRVASCGSSLSSKSVGRGRVLNRLARRTMPTKGCIGWDA